MYIVTAPWLLRKLFPSSCTWDIPNKHQEIFLTFDDGPHPIATPFVLDELKKYNAKATFFCIGKNVEQQQQLYSRLLDEGHNVGNHTYDHLNGKKTNNEAYLKNVFHAGEVINSKLFRPPYGAVNNSQVKQLASIYNIIMWSVLSADFDIKISKEKCLNNVIRHTKPGSVIVFHDSEKAFPNLEYVLPRALDFFTQKKYKMVSINAEKLKSKS